MSALPYAISISISIILFTLFTSSSYSSLRNPSALCPQKTPRRPMTAKKHPQTIAEYAK
jgi:hypothetical protein